VELKWRKGQTAVEYVVVFAALIVVVVALGFVVTGAKHLAKRSHVLVGSDYP